jgi:mannose-1-phosphate guanylyltransferase/mannose-6-phosphate isomerase
MTTASDRTCPPEKSLLLSRCHAIVLAGGSGTRLWPLSRALLPKQFLALKGEQTLLQQTAERMLNLFDENHIHVVTNEEHIFEVNNQLDALSPGFGAQVISEPIGRNTLPAILLGMDAILETQEDPLIAVFPSDHFIHNAQAWSQALQSGLPYAAQGWFVTFGITPSHPETGYGYIAQSEELENNVYEVAGFVEKPELARAEEFLSSGRYLWNSGIFLFSATALLAAIEAHQPELAACWRNRQERPLVSGYSTIPDISFDYGIMERVDRIAVVKADFGWDDLGSWEAMYRLGQKDAKQCVMQGDVLALGCTNSLFLSTGGKLAAVGLDNIIAVQTRDATLLCAMDQVQKVKDVVGLLKKQGSSLVETHLTVRRPWGSYTVLEEGPYYKIKRIEVLPSAKLSLQMHHHRSEHWVVIRGAAQVLVGEKELLLVENQSVDIPKATKHRLHNPGKVNVEIIEIQSGPYLEEDDIVRFEDVYGRIQS